MTEIVFRALRTLKVRRADKLPSLIFSDTYLWDQTSYRKLQSREQCAHPPIPLLLQCAHPSPSPGPTVGAGVCVCEVAGLGPPLAFPLVTRAQPRRLKDAQGKLPDGFLHDGPKINWC